MAIKVLVVEDDSFLIRAYVALLTRAGFDVRTAGDGIEALTVLDSFAPDVILLDLVMPRMDGFEALEEMRKRENLKTTPVIVTSNLEEKAAIDRAMGLGATEFVIKSDMPMEDLVGKINKYASDR